MAKWKGGGYNDDNDYNVRGGRSFSRASFAKGKGNGGDYKDENRASFPKSKLKGGYSVYNDNYNVHGGRSFDSSSFPKSKMKGVYSK